MARFGTQIESNLSQGDAFLYMADFANARVWDPSVSEAKRVGDASVGLGSQFDLVAKFAGRDVPLRYEIVGFESPRQVVLEAKRPGFVSRDTISVEASGAGSIVRYDAILAFSGIGRLFDPVMQLIFRRVGANATAGMKAALNR